MSEEVSFRDRPLNIDEKGKRKWVYAKRTKGNLFKYRTIVSWILVAFFVGAPFIKVNGHPFMLLDIFERKFIIFGAIFWAQDTFILALVMLSFVMFILLFTVTYGRLWCGWACPQTIFLEMIYRKIEILIEGDRNKRIKLDKSPLNAEKIIKKTIKHCLFIAVSALITLTFTLWFAGPDKLFAFFKEPIQENVLSYLIFGIVTAVFYWIYASFREQICTMVCPYGRMQGVLLDSKSIIVAYDYKRGEPRGVKNTGDCIDCKQCIAVCPTGIDIRNGTQLECINCTACIDECNIVMKKVNKPKGLIRFDSIEGIESGQTKIFNKRNISYSFVLLILFGFFLYTLITRPVIETKFLKYPGLDYQLEKGKVTNLYNFKIINKTYNDIPLKIKLISHEGDVILSSETDTLKKHDFLDGVALIKIDKDKLKNHKETVKVGVYDKDKLVETFNITFNSP